MPRVPEPEGIRRIPVGAIGAGSAAMARVARDVGEIGESWNRFFEKQRLAEAKREYSSAVAGITKDLNELQLEIDRNEEIKNVEQAMVVWEQRAPAIIQEYGSALRQPEAIELFTAESSRMAEIKRVAVNQEAYRKQRDAGRAVLFEETKEYERQYAEAATDLERQEIWDRLEAAMIASDYVPEEEKVARLAASRAAVDAGHVGHLIQAAAEHDNPVEARALLAEARWLIDASDMTPGLKESVKLRLRADIERIEAGIEREEKAAATAIRQDLVANLRVRASRGDITYEELDYHREQEKILPNEWANLTMTLDNVNREKTRRLDQLGLVKAAMAEDPILLDRHTAEHVEAVNYAYDTVFAPQIDALVDPMVRNAKRAEFVEQIGFAPKSMIGAMTSAFRVGTDAQILEAADLLDRLEQGNVPDVAEDIPERDRALGTLINMHTRPGEDPAIALQKAREIRQPADEGERAALKRNFSVEGTRVKNEMYLNENMGKTNGLFGFTIDTIPIVMGHIGWGSIKAGKRYFERDIGPFHFAGLTSRDPIEFEGWFRRNLVIPDGLKEEFHFLTEHNYLLTKGDLEASQKMAMETLKRRWAVTGIAGPLRWQRMAPEIFYANKHGTRWMSEHVREKLIELAKERPDAIPGVPEGDDAAKYIDHAFRRVVMLESDLETPREVNAETGKHQPGYMVMVHGDYGWEPVRGEDHRPMRIYFDWMETPAGKRQFARAEAERAKRAKQPDLEGGLRDLKATVGLQFGGSIVAGYDVRQEL